MKLFLGKAFALGAVRRRMCCPFTMIENTGFRAVYRSDKLFFFDPLRQDQNLYKNLMREILTLSGSHIVKYAQKTRKKE